MAKLNLRVPYSQSVTKIMLKPKILFLGYAEGNSRISDFIGDYNKLTKIFVPRSKFVSPKYISQFTDSEKKLITRSNSIFKTLRSMIYDINSLTYKLDKILYAGRSKLNKKYAEAIQEIFNQINLSELKNEGYTQTPLQYFIDVTTFTTKLTLGSMKHMFIGVLYAMFKDKQYPDLPVNQIILTLKLSEDSFVNYLIYDGKKFDIQRVIKIVNNYISLNESALLDTFNESVNEKLTYSDKIIAKLNVKDEKQINIVKNSLKQYYYKHPDQLDDKLTIDSVKLAVKESVEEAQEIEIKTTDFNKLLKQASESVPSAFVVKPSDEYSETFNGEFQGGNAINFRGDLFQKNLTDQLKIFAKYYESKYNMKVANISMKTKKTKSVFETTYSELTLTVIDSKTKKKQQITLNIPDVSDPNYIKQDGNKRVLLYQIYQFPITQPFPFTSMLKTNYASIEFSSKIKNKHRGLYTYIAGQTISALTLFFITQLESCSSNPKCKGNCVEYSLKLAGCKYKTGTDDSILNKELYSIKFEDKIYYVPESGDQKSKQLIWAFKQEFKKQQFKSCAEFKDKVENIYGIRYIQKVQQINQYIIDPITEFVLKSEKKSTDPTQLYKECIDNALTGEVTSETNLHNKRIRASESLAILIFKKITPAIDSYHNKKSADIKIDSNIILNEMVSGEVQSQYLLVDDNNPLAEVGALDMITYSGINGLNAEFAKDEVRMVDNTFYGNIDPVHSPDTSKVGVIRHLAVNSDIVNSTGKFTVSQLANANNIYSLADNYSPAPGHNDGNRIQYAAAQMQSDIPVKDAELPYIASKNSHIFTQIASNDFIIKSECDGKVIKVADDHIIIKCNKSKQAKVINFTKINEHTNNSATTNTPVVNEGDTIKKDQPIITAEEYFKSGNLSLGKNLYTLLKPQGVYNYEDGIVVSEILVDKLSSHHGTKQVVVIKENETVNKIAKINDVVTKADILVSKISQLEEAKLYKLDLNREYVRDLLEFDDILSDDLQDSSDEVNNDKLDQAESNDEFDTKSSVQDSEDSEYSLDEFSKIIYPDIAGTIYDMQIFAKNKDVLNKYPEIKKIRDDQIENLKASISEYQKEKFDTKSLEHKLDKIINCFGLEYKHKPVDNVLVIFNIHGYLGLGAGDKLHNRHGKLIAA